MGGVFHLIPLPHNMSVDVHRSGFRLLAVMVARLMPVEASTHHIGVIRRALGLTENQAQIGAVGLAQARRSNRWRSLCSRSRSTVSASRSIVQMLFLLFGGAVYLHFGQKVLNLG